VHKSSAFMNFNDKRFAWVDAIDLYSAKLLDSQEGSITQDETNDAASSAIIAYYEARYAYLLCNFVFDPENLAKEIFFMDLNSDDEIMMDMTAENRASKLVHSFLGCQILMGNRMNALDSWKGSEMKDMLILSDTKWQNKWADAAKRFNEANSNRKFAAEDLQKFTAKPAK
ncbi:MAG: hypothetical protein V3V10_06590, partial [Planctomycetota bacterium]